MARSGVLNVYIEDISPRARWIFKLLFEDLLGLKLNLTEDLGCDQPLLNYSNKDIPGSLSIFPAGLLSQKEIQAQKISMGEYDGLPVFFLTEGGDMPFDPFSMAFYLVSRYEEYLPYQKDAHGRFPHTESLAFKEGFLGLAMVNRLAIIIQQLLLQKFPDLEFNRQGYRFIPTIDVDIAYAHLGKGFVRTYGAMLKLILKGNIEEIQKRIKTMQGKAEDPYDNFDQLLKLFSGYSLDSVFFILAGDPGPNDRNLSLKNKRFAALLNRIAVEAELGVHPSYGAGTNAGIIEREINRIYDTCGKRPHKSRQHYVRMKFPETYEALMKAGISEDFSMGYASISGFRAGIASPFRFYNLKEEKETTLVIYPFMFMDSTLEDYMNLGPETYKDAVFPLIEETKKVGGTLIGIWHNYALADDEMKHIALKEIIKKASDQ